jgi:hypothetical protein
MQTPSTPAELLKLWSIFLTARSARSCVPTTAATVTATTITFNHFTGVLNNALFIIILLI